MVRSARSVELEATAKGMVSTSSPKLCARGRLCIACGGGHGGLEEPAEGFGVVDGLVVTGGVGADLAQEVGAGAVGGALGGEVGGGDDDARVLFDGCGDLEGA